MIRNLIVIVTLLLVAVLPFVTSEHKADVPSGVKIVRNLSYVPESSDPLQSLDLFLPRMKYGKKSPALPAIVWIHGGGWMEGSKLETPAIELAQLGFATVSINYRLAPKNTFPAQIYDCKAAIRWLKAHAGQYGIDPERVGVWGLSAGGHLAALLATTAASGTLEGELGNNNFSSEIAACCDWCGPTDLVNFREQCPPDATYSTISPPDMVDQFLGVPAAEDKELAKKASPITYVSENIPPTLIMHASEDPIVPFIQSQEFANKLEAAGAPGTMIKINSDDHVFLSDASFKAVTDFFDEKLKAKKSPPPKNRS